MVAHDFRKLYSPRNTEKKANKTTELLRDTNKGDKFNKLKIKMYAHTTSKRSKIKLTRRVENKVKCLKINNYIQKCCHIIYLLPINYNLKTYKLKLLSKK